MANFFAQTKALMSGTRMKRLKPIINYLKGIDQQIQF